jgi:hypothetical protein
MSIIHNTASIGWLLVALDRKRNRLGFLLRCLTGSGTPGVMRPSLFRKFTDLLDQIAVEREKELRIMHRIEAVEQQHRYLRAHHQLEQIARAHEKEEPASDYSKEYPGRPKRDWLWFCVLWYLFARRTINQKKQSLTVD